MSYSYFVTLEIAWMGIGLASFIYLLYKNAPYGRHIAAGWGPVMDNRLAWLLMESVVLLVLGGFVFFTKKILPMPVQVMVGLFFLHYIHRSFIFPFMTRTKGKKMPVVIAGSAILFNLINGAQLGYYFTHFAEYPTDWFGDPRFIVGILLFFTGAFINLKSDYYLIGLRKPGDPAGYKMPKGFLFDTVSCPNHFGEIVEWTGFAILTCSLPGLVFLFWTCANLIPRALAHRRWYYIRFPEYPEEKKAILPFIL